MNRDNLNYINSSIPINTNSNLSLNFPISSNIKDYSTLNSIHLNSAIHNSLEKEENKELTKMKISVLLNEVKNVIENSNYNLNFQLIHMKCFNLNQLGLQFEFFEILKKCLSVKLTNYAAELICFNNSVSEQAKINIDKNTFDNRSFNCKSFLNKFIEKYEEYNKICVKISETINILEIKSNYFEKFKIKGEEEINAAFSSNKFNNKSKIARFNFVFKIIFSLFFEILVFDDNIQKQLLENFFTLYSKIRNHSHNYITLSREIDECILSLKNSETKNTRLNNSDESSTETFNNEKTVSSNLKLHENNIELDCEKDFVNSKNIDKFGVSNFANLKKDDTIVKIKGILQKKNLLKNKNYSSLRNNSKINNNLIELNENMSTRKKMKTKLPLPDRIKAIFGILNDALAISVILSKEKLEDFLDKFDTCFASETKSFYAEYCKGYFENIEKLQSSDKRINCFYDCNKKEKSKKDKFSHYDISILNYKSDNEFSIGCSNYTMEKSCYANKNTNNNIIDLDLNIIKNNNYDERMFINRKIPKETNLKSEGDIHKNNYNTYCNGTDILNEREIYCEFDSALESKNKIRSSKYKNNKKRNNSLSNKIPVSIEGYILQVTVLLNLESDLNCDYNKKEDILNIILEKTLDEYEASLSEGLKKFIDKPDLGIIKVLFALYSRSEPFKEKFNKLLNNNVISILSVLEKNHIILNRYNRVEYVNFLFFVEEIFDIKKKFYLILKDCLNSYSRSELIIKTAMEKTVNKNFDFMENFVKLIHDEIKIAIKNKNPNRLKEFNEKFLSIYKLFNEKDLFEIEYRKYLSKRLLRNSSMVRESEYDFFEILRKESGAIYTRKIEKILDEIAVSYDLNIEYSQKYARNIRKSTHRTSKTDINNLIGCSSKVVSKDNAAAYCKNSFLIDNKNHNFAITPNINRNCNYFNSSNAEEDKNSCRTTPKPSNYNFNSSSSEINFIYDEKDHFKSNSLLNNQNINFNFTPVNVNNSINNNFSLMSSITANSAKNPNNKPIMNSIIFKPNINNKEQINNNLNTHNLRNIAKPLENNLVQIPNNSTNEFENANKFIDINVKVVSSDCWLLENINIRNNKRLNISEVKKHEDFNLPKVLDKYIKNFTEFYTNKLKNRQLKWIHEYSYAFIEMKASNDKVYNIIASSYQMSFLCLFNKNKNKKLTFMEILSLLGIKTEDDGFKAFLQLLKSHFLPIINRKLFLIQSKEKDEISEIDENDIFYLNPNFSQEENKIKLLNSIVEKKEVLRAEEKKEAEVSHFVLEDRKHQLDAIIIKILKRNKIVDFEKLKNLLIEEVKKFFIPENKFIKTRLENLIDRNFVKRNEDDYNFYEYM